MATDLEQPSSSGAIVPLEEQNKRLNEAYEAQDWNKQADLISQFWHSNMPANPAIAQLYNGSTILSGGAAEAKVEIEKSKKLLAADLEFGFLVSGKGLPDQATLVANALFEFIKTLEDGRPGIVARAVSAVRENLAFNQKRLTEQVQN